MNSEELKQNLIDFLRTRPQFRDYNFEASNLSVLLDLLARNASYHAFLTNMLISEAFLDTAQLRSSVLSHARFLGYTPRSAKSATSILHCRFTTVPGTAQLKIPRGTRFIARSGNETMFFVTDTDTTLLPQNSSGTLFVIQDLRVYEGTLVTEQFVVSDNARVFVLQSPMIDMDSIRVYVNGQEWKKASDVLDVRQNDRVFFTAITAEDFTELYFGDNIIGKQLDNGSLVRVEYRVTRGSKGNLASNFTLSDNLAPVNGVTSVTSSILDSELSFGGSDGESTEEIRLRAPVYFQTQKRGVTARDLAILVLNKFGMLKNAYVYNDFGTTYVVTLTHTGELLSETIRNEIRDFLETTTMLGSRIEVLNPSYIYIDLAITAHLDNPVVNRAQFEADLFVALTNFNSTKLMDFMRAFYASECEADCLAALRPRVRNLQIFPSVRKYVPVARGERIIPTWMFNAKLIPSTIRSTSTFRSAQGFVRYSDQENEIRLTNEDDFFEVSETTNRLLLMNVTNPNQIVSTDFGVIDYDKGLVKSNELLVQDVPEAEGLGISARVKTDFIIPRGTDILRLDVARTKIRYI